MVDIIEAVAERKADRAKLGLHLTKSISFVAIAFLAFLFKG